MPTITMKMAYPAIIHAEEGVYWTEFPDVEGCFCQEDTLAEVIAESEHALGLHLCAILDDGGKLPKASALADVRPEDGFTTVIVTDPLRYKKNTRAVKKTLTLPGWLNEEAEKRHINFSAVLQKALLAEIA